MLFVVQTLSSHTVSDCDKMLRRFSTKFGKSKHDQTDGVNGTNGITNGTTNGVDANGTHTNGTSAEKPDLDKRRSSFGFRKGKQTSTDHSASRDDIENSFAQFAQLIHASQRPLPNQSGDGAYLDHKEPSGLMADVKSLGFKDVHTLMDVMKTKATGALQDDKTYIMEKTIQVSSKTSPLLVAGEAKCT